MARLNRPSSKASHINQHYRFDQLPAALDHLDRDPFGKIVLTR
ncbi:hypothetical protein [Serratia silvae]|nr:hypothetical protein [Serratia silvae]